MPLPRGMSGRPGIRLSWKVRIAVRTKLDCSAGYVGLECVLCWIVVCAKRGLQYGLNVIA
jgi:hypothetical protein